MLRRQGGWLNEGLPSGVGSMTCLRLIVLCRYYGRLSLYDTRALRGIGAIGLAKAANNLEQALFFFL